YYDDGYCEDKPDEGIGNIPCAPYFKDPVNDVYHLESYSPCIDMGNPASDYSNEPDYPNGRINMGAYGNTADATTKGADNDNDGIPDAWESIYGDLDPVNDEDDDNLINIGEYYYGTNPQNVDTDNDNRNDYWEVTYGMDPLEDEDVPECGFYAHDLPYVTSFEPCQKYETLKSVHYQNGWKVYEGSAWINYETMEVTPTEGDPYWLKINYLQLEPGARVGKIFNDEYIPDPYQTNYRMLSVRLIPQVGMYVHVLNGEDIIACIGFLEDKVEVQSWDTVNKVTKLEVDWDWDVDWTGGWGILSFTLDFDGWPHDHYTVHWEDEGLRKQDPLEQYYFGKRFPGSGKAFLAYNHKFLTEVAFYNSPLSENSFCVDRMSLSRDVGILAGLDTKFWSNCYIDSPKGFGQKTYTGEVPITGYIMCSQLGKYEVCFFPNNVWPPLDPTNGADYIRICSGYDIVEEGDTMGTWNLSSLSGGHYNLLLILFWDKYTADENYEHDDPRWNLLYAADCLYEDFRVSNNKVAPSLSFEEVDISVPWPGQFPFELKRTFNNNRRFSKKPFPNGWTHNFQMTISEVTTYQNAAWNEESGFFYQIDDGDCLPFGQIQVTYPDGSTRVFTHKEESEQATTATYYPVEPELSPGDVVTRKPLWYRIEDVPGFWILSIYYELRLSDGTIVRFDNAKYFESFYDTDYDGHNDPMPWIRIDPSEGEEGFMWKVVGGVSSVEDRFGNQLDVEWKKEEVIEGFGEVKPIVVTKVGYKRGDDKTIAIEFEPGEYDYYISAKLKYDGNVYRTINYDWDLYDIGWVFTISAEGKGAGPRDIWSDKDYVLAEYFYKSNMNLRSICRNGKLVTTATYSDDGRLEHREDFVDSEDSELYPWPKHFIYDFEPEEEPSVNL
ncbi:MAG: hypothetical protein GWN00_04285, partial [Aliifodinibius sp.]|nr:hypothetical protein [Fodinibius sp.]NIX55273.1 hypothetical protein [candidate division Zixibacteria bacterium]NIY24049.1 hypothetical protein [Fodinibius sp.]